MAQGDRKGTLQASNVSIPDPFIAVGSVSVALGDLIICVLAQQTSLTVTGVTDNLGNTYTAQNAGTDAGQISGRLFWSVVEVAGTLTAVSADTTAGTSDAAIGAVVYEGRFVSLPVDANPANISNDVTSPFVGPATGTRVQANELVVGWMATQTSQNYAAVSPFLEDLEVTTSTTSKVCIASVITSDANDLTPSWTAGAGPTNDVLGVISFKMNPIGRTVSLSEISSVIAEADFSKTLNLSKPSSVSMVGDFFTTISKLIRIIGGDVYGGIAGSAISALSISGSFTGATKSLTLQASRIKTLVMAKGSELNLSRRLSKTVVVLQEKVLSVIAPPVSLTFQQIVDVVQDKSVSLFRVTAQALNVAQGKVLAFAHLITKLVSVDQAKTLAVRKAVSTATFSLTMAKVVTAGRVFAKLQSISIVQAKDLSLDQVTVKVFSVLQGKTVSLIRLIDHFVTVVQAKTVTLFNAIPEQLSIIQGKTLAFSSVVTAGQGLILETTQAKTLLLFKGPARPIRMDLNKGLSVLKTGHKRFSLALFKVPLLRLPSHKIFTIAQSKFIQVFFGPTLLKTLQVLQGKSITLRRRFNFLLIMSKTSTVKAIKHFPYLVDRIDQAKALTLAAAKSLLIRVFHGYFWTSGGASPGGSLPAGGGSSTVQGAFSVSTAFRFVRGKTLTIPLVKVMTFISNVSFRTRTFTMETAKIVLLTARKDAKFIAQVLQGKVAVLFRALSHSTRIDQTKIVQLFRPKTILRAMNVTQAKTARLLRRASPRLVIGQGKALTIRFIKPLRLLVEQSKVLEQVFVIGRRLIVQQAKVVRLVKAGSRAVAIEVEKAARLVKATTRRFVISQAKVATLIRSTRKVLILVQAKAASLARAASKQMIVLQDKAVQLARSTVHRVLVDTVKTVRLIKAVSLVPFALALGKVLTLVTKKTETFFVTISVTTAKVLSLVRRLIDVLVPVADTFNMYQDATYWAPLLNTGFGEVTFLPPVRIKCRWQNIQQLFRSDGQELQSHAVVYTDRTLQNKGYLALGDHTAQPNPRLIDGSREVRATRISPSPRGDRQLNKVWL